MRVREKSYTVQFTNYTPESTKEPEIIHVKARTPKDAIDAAFRRRQTIKNKQETATIYEADVRDGKTPVNTVVVHNRLFGSTTYYFYVVPA